jgi:hypothetical protein
MDGDIGSPTSSTRPVDDISALNHQVEHASPFFAVPSTLALFDKDVKER